MLDITQTFLLASERLRLSVERMFISRHVQPYDISIFSRFYDEFNCAYDNMAAQRAKNPPPPGDRDALQMALIALIASCESVVIGLKVGFVRFEGLDDNEKAEAAMKNFEHLTEVLKRMAELFGRS